MEGGERGWFRTSVFLAFRSDFRNITKRRDEMHWKKLIYLVCMGLLIVGFSLPAAACDDEDDNEQAKIVKVQAPIEAVDCAATPPTITVLGLKIDISKASINGEDSDDDEDGGLTCADLTVGQAAKVTLISAVPTADSADPPTPLLLATKVETEDDDLDDDDVAEVKISAPLQAVDPNVPSVTVLGLIVDITNAVLKGDDEPISANQLRVGQFAFLKLVSNVPPPVRDHAAGPPGRS